jgi:pilus assembly protein CpaB
VSLRTSLRQAVYLAAAQDFARDVRVLPRAPGDRRRGSTGMRVGSGL